MDNRVFIGELLQDLPIWTAIVMSLYPSLKNEIVFYLTLGIGVISSIYIWYLMKRKIYTLESLMEKPSESFAFMIYSFLILIFLIFLTFKELLVFSSIVWLYLLITSIGEFIFLRSSIFKK
jgi:hypothetical protein